jgi:ribosomal protein L11 methyltransferase
MKAQPRRSPSPLPASPSSLWPAWFVVRAQTTRRLGRQWFPRLLHLDPSATLWSDADRDRARIETYHADRATAIAARSRYRELFHSAGIPSTRIRLSLVFIPPANWADAWKKFFHSRKISPRLTVAPPWENPTSPKNGWVLSIDPGRSFGTGLHATTRACLVFLDRIARENPGRSVLDLGCGSGILSIAAARLGFHTVRGIDTDPIAVQESELNAQRNGLGDRIIFSPGFAERIPSSFRSEVVVANLLGKLLLRHAPAIARTVRRKPGAALILSGIRKPEFPRVQARFERLGFTLRATHTRANWTTGWMEWILPPPKQRPT